MNSNPLAKMVLGIAIVLAVAGCTKTDTGAASGSSTSAPSAVASGIVMGNADRGMEVFRGNCSRCHGTSGAEGGVGPALAHEVNRKNYEQTIAWIKNPAPPMPKLYPSPLDDRAVRDVASYVQRL